MCTYVCALCPNPPPSPCSIALPLPLALALALTLGLALASHLHWISDSKLPSLLLWNAVTINEFSTINIPKFCPEHTRTHTSTHTRRERQAQAHTHEWAPPRKMRPRCGPRILIFHFWHLLTLRKCLRASVISSSCVLSVCARVCVCGCVCLSGCVFTTDLHLKAAQTCPAIIPLTLCLAAFISLSLSPFPFTSLSLLSLSLLLYLACSLPPLHNQFISVSLENILYLFWKIKKPKNCKKF